MLRSMIRTRSAHVLRIFYARSTPAPPRSPRLAPSASVLERVRLSVCPPARVPAAAAAPSLPLQPLHPHPWQATVRGRAARTYANMTKSLLESSLSEKLSEAKEDLNQADRATRKPTPTPQSPDPRSRPPTQPRTRPPIPNPDPNLIPTSTRPPPSSLPRPLDPDPTHSPRPDP